MMETMWFIFPILRSIMKVSGICSLLEGLWYLEKTNRSTSYLVSYITLLTTIHKKRKLSYQMYCKSYNNVTNRSCTLQMFYQLRQCSEMEFLSLRLNDVYQDHALFVCCVFAKICRGENLRAM